MRMLAIETSCDETGVCIIEASGDHEPSFQFEVLGNALTSQAALHAQYGGVFPNLAKREHAKALVPLLDSALTEARVSADGSSTMPGDAHGILSRERELFEALARYLSSHGRPDIDAIAVTVGPGLEPALWVGINFAKALSLAWDIPVVPVNHMEGHIALSMMHGGKRAEFEFPLLSLLISGGHTELVLSREFGQYERIGQTRDDAAGEAFDKVARLLGLPYPGGPEISRLAREAREAHIPRSASFTRPMLHEKNFDFSFSGLKTAVRKTVEASQPLSDRQRMDIAREFEDTVADVLVAKTMRAVDEYGVNTVLVGGGVSANTYVRETLKNALAKAGNPATLLVPPPEWATDNALMIALAAYFHAAKNEFVNPTDLIANGNLSIEKQLL